jgi:GT2 family glycosyltransferase
MVAEPAPRLVLLLVAFHPGAAEVEVLQSCLAQLPESIAYAVFVNDHRGDEPVDRLESGALIFIRERRNLGYGRAMNRLAHRVGELLPSPPSYLGLFNTDLSWQPGELQQMIAWMDHHPQVALAVPRIVAPDGEEQKLCKRDPTLLSLFSRRFLPESLKPRRLRHYDQWYVMADYNYDDVFDVPYLSGCCMFVRTQKFLEVGGFDDRYFLYLEDADLTRSLRATGRCVHVPRVAVTHAWGRGNHNSRWLTLVNLQSAWIYFRKWGLRLW